MRGGAVAPSRTSRTPHVDGRDGAERAAVRRVRLPRRGDTRRGAAARPRHLGRAHRARTRSALDGSARRHRVARRRGPEAWLPRRCATRSASTFPAPGWRCCTSSSHRSSSLVATSTAPRTSRTERARAACSTSTCRAVESVTGPVLVYFHGGGYRGGAKNREARPLVYRLASQGWLCVSASYALRPAPFSESLADARRAVAWARTRAR